MPLFVLSFLIGVVAVQHLALLPTIGEIGVICLLSLLCVYKRAWYLAICMIAIIWTVIFAQARLESTLPKNKEGVEIQISGYIDSLPKYDDRRVRFDFMVDPPQKSLPNKLRLSWYFSKQTLRAGQYWRFTVRLKRPHGMLNPSGFDYERALFKQGIGATGYIRKPTPVLLAEKNKKYHIARSRQWIADQLQQLNIVDKNLALIKALSIGESSQVKEEQWSVLRKTGTVHLLAISGLHIGLVAGLVFFLMRKFWGWTGILNCSAQTFAAYSALLIAFCYAVLAGFSIPTQRALLMLGVAMMLTIYQRHLLQSTTLAWVLLVILLFDPFAVLSGGFWLSFFAVVIILYCNNKRLGKTRWFYQLFKTHFILTLGLSPLLLFFYQQVSIISPVANFIAIPWVSFIIVPCILLAVLMMLVFPWLAV